MKVIQTEKKVQEGGYMDLDMEFGDYADMNDLFFEDDAQPEDEDAFISSNGYKYTVSVDGTYIGEYVEIDDAERSLKKWMDKNKYYPPIWFVDDHGGVESYMLEKGKTQKSIIIEKPFIINNKVIVEKGDCIKIIQFIINNKAKEVSSSSEMFKGDDGYRFDDEIAAY